VLKHVLGASQSDSANIVFPGSDYIRNLGRDFELLRSLQFVTMHLLKYCGRLWRKAWVRFFLIFRVEAGVWWCGRYADSVQALSTEPKTDS
jgi:hypothetical protein